jgi:hypothetical protein
MRTQDGVFATPSAPPSKRGSALFKGIHYNKDQQLWQVCCEFVRVFMLAGVHV